MFSPYGTLAVKIEFVFINFGYKKTHFSPKIEFSYNEPILINENGKGFCYRVALKGWRRESLFYLYVLSSFELL